MMSLAYTQLYRPEDHSAHYVQKLISLGAVIVGKTKMTAFASADEPTDMWIDYHCPLNPRGDRYQSPSGSSTGAAASLAGYEWLDYSMGADSKFNFLLPTFSSTDISSWRQCSCTCNLEWAILASTFNQHNLTKGDPSQQPFSLVSFQV